MSHFSRVSWWLLRKRDVARLEEQAAITCHVDQVTCETIQGWAFDPSRPDRRVRLSLIIDGDQVAEGLAEIYRVDLATHGFGDGHHGFRFTLPPGTATVGRHRIDLRDAATNVMLVSESHFLDRAFGATAVRTARLFDASFYVEQAGAVSAPLAHYRETGWREGFRPHPLFDPGYYVDTCGTSVEGDPLAHFATTGWHGHVSTHPLLARAEPSSDADEHPLFAYLQWPAAPSLALPQFFNEEDYVGRVDAAGGVHPLVHYLSAGWKEGRRPHRDFDPGLFHRMAGLSPQEEPYTQFARHLRTGTRTTHRGDDPRVSIIILNYDKSLLTLQAVYFLERHTDLTDVQIIVVDNGSSPGEFDLLCRYGQGLDLVRLGTNRGFGEGNNIGAEHARGEFLVFLNNDCFVLPDWLPPLLETIGEDDGIGAVGGKLLFPDGSLQEAGASISSCGAAIQRGRSLEARTALFSKSETVDYCSAAALLVRADLFRDVFGFDLCWDPAYYEDVDLCFKLRAIGKRTVYVPACRSIHIEHATASDARLALDNVVAINRRKFLNRWAAGGTAPPLSPAPSARQPRHRRRLCLFTPYPLTAGGGERFILSIAAALASDHACVLLTTDRYSRLRLLTLGRDLGLDLADVELASLDQGRHPVDIDIFIAMGNALLPPIKGLGRLNLYICQFPFPMAAEQRAAAWHRLADYECMIAYSRFAADHIRAAAAALDVPLPLLKVLSPAVPQARPSGRASGDHGIVRLLNVGRFTSAGHCKRQDLMIDAFAQLAARVDRPLELHLAGSLNDDPVSRAYFQGLVERARHLPVEFYPNASAERVSALYEDARLYWHMTGAKDDVARHPERFEHFGIALIEAMSAGCVPLSINAGGPVEIIRDGETGVLVASRQDLVLRSAELLADELRCRRIGKAAVKRAADFSPAHFETRLRALISEVEDGVALRSTFRKAAQ